MKKDRIRDIPSISKPLREVKDILALRDAMPYIRPLLLSQGVDINEIESQLAEVDRLYKEAVEIVSMYDRFNDLFAQRGWISYEFMDANVSRAAIIKAEEGDSDGAEEILVSYYNAETVEIHLRRMIAVQAFKPRFLLAEKALVDYREERYHACVPLIIMLLDGMVNEVNQRRGIKKGFHAQDVNLEAWDSIAGHSTGLAKLRDVICASRETTKTEIITVPYRHGIMHGMDLGYDTKLVAAKAWAALFAVREWALLAERGQLEPRPEEPKPTQQKVRKLFDKVQNDKKRLNEWKPRKLSIGKQIPPNGVPVDYDEGTPERKLVEFLDYWKQRNYGRMSECIMKMLIVKPVHVKEMYRDLSLDSFDIIAISDNAASQTDITVELVINNNNKRIEGSVVIGLIYQTADGSPSIRGKTDGLWWIQNWGHPISKLIYHN